MVRLFAVLLLVGCSTVPGGASFDGDPDTAAGAATEPTAGSPTSAGASAGGLTSGGSAAGNVVAKGGQDPEPTAGAPTVAGTVSASGSGGTGPATAGAGGSSAGQATAGAPSAGSSNACPPDFYCHELGADAFAKCVTRAAPADPQFPTCEITEGACFFPKDAPESCIKAECWSKKRTCP